jgi:hypothetical protein
MPPKNKSPQHALSVRYGKAYARAVGRPAIYTFMLIAAAACLTLLLRILWILS